MKRHRLPSEQELDYARMARLRAKIRAMVVETEGPLALPCWIWQGHLHKGYGKLGWEGEYHRAHRLAYRAWCGPIPDYTIICHICNVPFCVNPAHLYAGTDASNLEDLDRAGGVLHGEEAYGAILNDAKVLAIIALLDKGYTVRSVARQFGVSNSTIYNIADGRQWKHLPRPEGFALRYRGDMDRRFEANRRAKAKLTRAQVREIRALIAAGQTNAIIAAQFNVDSGTIRHIRVGNTWRGVV